MVLSSLILGCAMGVAPDTMQSIIKTESGGSLYAIHSGGTRGKSYYPKTKNEAVLLANKLLGRGERLDLGAAQINTANLKWLGLSVNEVLDPCTNIKAGAYILRLNYNEAMSKWTNNKAKGLQHAISMYNTGDNLRGVKNGYYAKVVKASFDVPSIQLNRIGNFKNQINKEVVFAGAIYEPNISKQTRIQNKKFVKDVFLRKLKFTPAEVSVEKINETR